MSVFADFAQEVGGDLVAVTTIVLVGGDPHTYVPTPSDAILLSDADVVLDNGLGLSPWFESLQTNIGGDLVILTDGIAGEARQAGDKVDPHLWMVPEFVAEGYVTAIEQTLAAADPANADATVLEIALDSGFASKATFNRVFKETTGQTPSAYRAASGV